MPRTGRRVSLPAHTALPDVRPEARRALRGPSEHPCGSSWTTTSHDRGSPSSSGSSSRSPTSSGSCSGRSRSSSRIRRLDPRARAGRVPDPLHRFLAAYIRYATHPSRSSASSAAASRASRGAPAVRDRHRDRSADASEPVDDALPLLPRDPGVHPRERARRRRVRDCARLVVRARDRADAGDAEPRRRLPALLGTDVRVLPPRHEPVPVRRADPARRRPTWDGPLPMPSPAPPLVGDAF